MIKFLKPDFIFKDQRGCLTQLVREGYNQINVTEAVAGSKRGGHYHKLNNEAFYIVRGSFDLVARKDGEETKQSFYQGDMFLIPPYVTHDFIFKEDTIFISMYDKGVELNDNRKDIYVG
jgi:dTDP-4-dehydrorhamnose 3,5-epimerase-like enzyme